MPKGGGARGRQCSDVSTAPKPTPHLVGCKASSEIMEIVGDRRSARGTVEAGVVVRSATGNVSGAIACAMGGRGQWAARAHQLEQHSKKEQESGCKRTMAAALLTLL